MFLLNHIECIAAHIVGHKIGSLISFKSNFFVDGQGYLNSADRSFLCSLPPSLQHPTDRARRLVYLSFFLPLLSLPHQVQKKNSFSILLLLRSAPTDATRCDPNPTRVAASFFSPAGMVQRGRVAPLAGSPLISSYFSSAIDKNVLPCCDVVVRPHANPSSLARVVMSNEVFE